MFAILLHSLTCRVLCADLWLLYVLWTVIIVCVTAVYGYFYRYYMYTVICYITLRNIDARKLEYLVPCGSLAEI